MDKKNIGIVVPHGAYCDSGPIAAQGYAQLLIYY
jgi:AmmeMemoRadiSam system protein B